MTLPRSAADVLSGHVVFELECIDRLYCNLYVPKLQRELGVAGVAALDERVGPALEEFGRHDPTVRNRGSGYHPRKLAW